MNKIAFKMKLNPDAIDEYKKRYKSIWPEIKEMFSKNGISDFTIFFDEETNTLFAVQKIEGESSSQDLGNQMWMKKWWRYLSDIIETKSDLSPVTIPLEKVFHMD